MWPSFASSSQLPAASSAISNRQSQSTLDNPLNRQSTISFNTRQSPESTIDNLTRHSTIRNQQSLHRFPRDFLDRRDPFHHLVQAAPAQRDHAFLDRFAPEF